MATVTERACSCAGAAAVLLAAFVLLGGCAPPPIDIDASLALGAGAQMESVSAFAIREGGEFDIDRWADRVDFHPSLLDEPRFGLFVVQTGQWLNGRFADISAETDPPRILIPYSGDNEQFHTQAVELDSDIQLVSQRAFDAAPTTVFTSTVARGADVELSMLYVNSAGDPPVRRGTDRLYDWFRDNAAGLDAGAVGIAAGTTVSSSFLLHAAAALFDDNGQWRIVVAGFDINEGLASTVQMLIDVVAPPSVDAASGGRLHLAERGAGDWLVFISIPDGAGLRNFRLLTAVDSEYHEIAPSSQIETILSNNRLLVRSRNSYQIFDFDGQRRSQFTAGGLRFVFERPIGTDWYSYFSVSYRGRVDGEDYLFVRVYRVRTDRLGTLD